MEYTHYCKPCRKFFACTNGDPEKFDAFCPYCKGFLKLSIGSLEKAKKELGLHRSELGEGEIKYVHNP